MKKTIFITGATDGIGLETAKNLAEKGHNLIIHGRNAEKLNKVKVQLEQLGKSVTIDTYIADLSSSNEVKHLASQIAKQHKIDVLINNAGVFKIADTTTSIGIDVRFVVNTIAPYILTTQLMSAFNDNSRVINLSSAAQAPVNLDALQGKVAPSSAMEAYAQSKLAITMWSHVLANKTAAANVSTTKEPIIISVNPGSLLASKMVTEGFGVQGNDISIGSNILTRLALDSDMANANGKYFDNDIGKFSMPHPDGFNIDKGEKVIEVIESIIKR